MTELKTKAYADFVLPPSIVSRLDISRLVREVEQIDNELTTAAVRAKTGSSEQVRPILSQQLVDFLQLNTLTISEDSRARTELIKQLRLLKEKAPSIHMTFAVKADQESLQRLTAWLRTSVHPQSLIAVGLQPALIAGVYVRTPNHVHDLSLRAKLAGSHDLLVKELEVLRGRS